jgi:hypothetical protein
LNPEEATLVGFSMGGGKWFAISVVMAEKEFQAVLIAPLRHFNCKQTQSKGVPQENDVWQS